MSSLYYAKKYTIDGMHCHNCVNKVEEAMKELLGHKGRVKVQVGKMEIEANGRVTDEEILEKIKSIGFQARLEKNKKMKTMLERDVVELEDLEPEFDAEESDKMLLKETVIMKERNRIIPALVHLSVKEMSCSSCVSNVEKCLYDLGEGVISASVTLLTEEAEVQFDERILSVEDIRKAVASIGHPCTVIRNQHGNENKQLISLQLSIEGMSCPNCVSKIENSLKKVNGIKSVGVNLLMNSATVDFDGTVIGKRTIIEKISNLGFTATVSDPSNFHDTNAQSEFWNLLRRSLICVAFTFPLFCLSLVDEAFLEHSFPKIRVRIIDVLYFLLSTPVHIWGGWNFHAKATKALSHLYFDMNVLISLGTNVAYFCSVSFLSLGLFFPSISKHASYYFETSAMIITFQNIGKFWEALAKQKTNAAITSLIQLQPRIAHLVTNAQNSLCTDVASDLLQIDDVVKVFPGEKFPADGIIENGKTSCNESMITGESKSVLRTVGDSVIGGTINESGVVFVKVTKIGDDSMLQQIVNLVKKAQLNKAPIQRYSDELSKIFIPSILIISFFTFLFWICLGLTIMPESWIPKDSNLFLFSLKFPLAVLVVACPCALGLATPTAVLVGTGVGAKNGILIKGGEPLEMAYRVNVIVFDKTGTLTVGKPQVVMHHIASRTSENGTKQKIVDENTFYYALAIAESGSEHPIGKRLFDFAMSKTDKVIPQDFTSETLPGKGILCKTKDDEILVGTLKLMEENKIKVKKTELMLKQKRKGRTITFIALNSQYIGFTSLEDTIRPESRKVISQLRRMKIRTIMLSGDSNAVVQCVQDRLELDEVHGEVLPAQKVHFVETLKRNNVVAMVGDGINDSPALAEAHVGISIGAGTEVAIQSSDIVLVKSNLKDVITSIELSRATFRRIQLNHFWAMGYNIIFIPLACGVLYPIFGVMIPPLLASCTMVGSSLLVLTSSLLLSTFQPSMY